MKARGGTVMPSERASGGLQRRQNGSAPLVPRPACARSRARLGSCCVLGPWALAWVTCRLQGRPSPSPLSRASAGAPPPPPRAEPHGAAPPSEWTRTGPHPSDGVRAARRSDATRPPGPPLPLTLRRDHRADAHSGALPAPHPAKKRAHGPCSMHAAPPEPSAGKSNLIQKDQARAHAIRAPCA